MDASGFIEPLISLFFVCFSPHHCGVFVFLLASRLPPSVVRRPRPPSAALTVDLTQLISHTTHLTHTSQNVSHTQLISHTSSHTSHHTPLISQTHTSQNLSHHTQVISHHTQLIPHHTPLISHTTHLTHLISYITSHTTHLTHSHTHHKTYLIHNSSHTTLIHNSSHTPHLNSSHVTHRLKELRRGLSPEWPRLFFVWQAQYTELPDGAAARIVAGVAAAVLRVAGAVHRAS